MGQRDYTFFMILGLTILMVSASVIFGVMARISLDSQNYEAAKKWGTISSVIGGLTFIPFVVMLADVISKGWCPEK